MRQALLIGTVVAALGAGMGCEEMKDNPRTSGTVGGAAAGAAIGAAVDHDQPLRGAAIGGVAGGAAGNAGGAVYKDKRN